MKILNKEVKNAGWLIGGKIAQMVLSLLVGLLTARYLGPGNYGTINYIAAYVSFFTSFCTLGINSIIIKDFVDHPDEQGEAIGSSILLRLLSSLCSIVMILSIVSIADAGDRLLFTVAVLCSVALIFQTFDTINYWFQSRYQSKITSIASLIAYASVSVYKIILLILQKDIYWFAFSTSVDYIVVAVVLLIAYRKNNGPQLKFSFKKSRELLARSYHYILSGMMVAIYGQTDKLMLKHILNETEVGYYSTATHICTLWVFVLAAIIDSMYPTILNLYKSDKLQFERKNRQLYAIVFYVSVFVSLCFVVFGKLIVSILYGKAYLPAVGPLKIITWYTAFSYLGVARNAWLVCENKQKYLKFLYAAAAVMNIGLNLLFIPLWGASGAAFASLLTQILSSIVFPALLPAMRPNTKLMLSAVMLRDVFPKKKHPASKPDDSGR